MPITTIKEARNEILDHFTTAWNAGAPPIPLLLYDDKHVDLPENDHYARIMVQHNLTLPATVGAPTALSGNGARFRRLGIVTVQIFTISGDGLTQSDDLVNLAVDAFEGESTGSDRIEFRNTRANEVGQDGPWFQTNVIAEFEYDRVK